MNFGDINLHDATLHSINFDWKAKNVVFIGVTYWNKPLDFKLVFNEVSHAEIPHTEEWGPSVYIHELNSNSEGVFELLMQTGDNIIIRAKTFKYETAI